MTKQQENYYYAKEQMVKDLLRLTPYNIDDVILDAGSGKNKIWFNNFNCKKKLECEIEDGCDFYKWNKKTDWVVGNPPFHESWKFFDKASQIARCGIAFLINNLAMNSWTPKRYELMKKRGFYLQKIHIVLDKRWFGRYYYLLFTKEKNNFISWETKTYGKKE